MRRRNTLLRAAMENYSEEERPLSMEEQELYVSEAEADLAEANETGVDADRLEDIAESLENVCNVAEKIDEATPSDLIMVESAARLAVAGTDIDYEEVTPGLEQYVGTTISMEGVRSMISQLWEAIKAAVRKIYEKIEGFFYKIFAAIPRLRRSIEALRKRAGQTSGKSVKETKTPLGREVNSLMMSHSKTSFGGADLLAGFSALEEQCVYFMETRAADIEKLGKGLVEGMNSFDFQKGEKSLKVILEKVQDHKWAKQPKFIPVKDSRFAKDEYVRMSTLPGAMAIYLKDGSISAAHSDGGRTVLGSSEEIRRTAYSIMAVSPSYKSSDTGEVSTLSTGDIETLCAHAERVLTALEKYSRGGAWDKVKKVRKDLEKVTDGVTKKGEADRDLTSVELDYYRSAIKFSNFYARLSTQPMASLTSHAMKVIRAMIVASNKSLSNYA